MKMNSTKRSLLAAAASIVLIAACSGEKEAETAGGAPAPAPVDPAVLPNDQQAVRFLSQATFGATQADVNHLKQIGYDNWITEQLAMPRSSHLDFVRSQIPLPIPANTTVTMDPLYYSFWRQAMAGQDQLRQRVTFALSQILVTSTADTALATSPHTMASYLDVLAEHSFGNYRDMLQAVTTHPAMGQYLTALGNRGDGGRTPDENYAREVMQLFTIGLYELNMDGTQKMVNGAAVDTYDMDDIRGMAHVLTGWSWGNQGTADPSNGRFSGNPADPMRRVIPMQFYPQYHSPAAKTFLSTTIPAGTNGVQALRTALDALFAHPNAAPFVSRTLIQRLVTSNPSPAYVQRVSQVFANDGQSVRGNLRAVVRAVLLDPEARDMNNMASAQSGKLREPVLRLATMLRAFEATSQTGNWRITNLDNSMFQTPMRAPTVFNFFRPGYVPPNSEIATRGLVGPEFQIAHEVSVATYANTMQNWVPNGLGSVPANSGLTGNDVRPAYTAARGMAGNVDQLIDHVNLMMTYNTMSTETRTAIRTAVNSVNANSPNNRVNLAVFMTMMSPEFLVQK